ncbi:MAG: class I SAM-dependent methyltransferase [Chloroflexota bacterium]
MYDQIARYYQLTHADLTEDFSFWHELIASLGTHVLELGCGSGRLLPHLAKKAHFVHGVDVSAPMLTLAKETIAQLPIPLQERITLTDADMSQLDLPWANDTFHLIGIPYNTFLHLDTVAATQTLKRIRPYFAENGRLFIDIINPFFIAETPSDSTLLLEETFHNPDSDETVLQFAANQLDADSQTLKITWVFDATPTQGGAVQRTVSTMAYHYRYPHQLQLLFQECGYQPLEQFGDYDRSPFNEDSPRLLLIAEPVR